MAAPSLIWADSPSVVMSLLNHERRTSAIGCRSWENPSLMSWKESTSLSGVRVGYEKEHQSAPVVTEEGRGGYDWLFDAHAYIHSGSSTVWGEAGYSNGVLSAPLWNESGEYQRIQPYLIADSIGGDLRRERYNFAGGYARRGSRVSWGVEGGYEAVLSYRQKDPRPENISGDLNLKAGIAVSTFSDYLCAASAVFERYRLSTDISFVSEMGASKLYHLTGLGTRYTRFDGTGSQVYNDSYRFGGTLNILPSSGPGFLINSGLDRTTTRHVIADLNRLPLASLSGTSGYVEAGYKCVASIPEAGYSCSWGVWGGWNASRIHGTENIFGDAATGSYPVIGDLELYADNRYGGSVSGYVGLASRRWEWHLHPSVGWNHHRIIYLYPRREWLDENLTFGLKTGATLTLSRKSYVTINGGWQHRAPTASALSRESRYADKEDLQLWRVVTADYEAATARADFLDAGVAYHYLIAGKYLAGAGVEGCYSNYSHGIEAYSFIATIFIKF